MTTTHNPLDNLRVVSPCSVDWDSMTGNDEVRFCRHCNLDVHDISNMTRKQAESLVARSQGRLCARIRRREDGRVVTKHYADGLRAVKRRVSFVAGAALAALMGLFTSAAAQTSSQKDNKTCPNGEQVVITTSHKKSATQGKQSKLVGTVTDIAGAVLHGAKLSLKNERTGQLLEVESDYEGTYSFVLPEAGSYTLNINMFGGFKQVTIVNIEVEADEEVRVDATIPLDGFLTLTGVVAIDYDESNSFREMKKLPGVNAPAPPSINRGMSKP